MGVDLKAGADLVVASLPGPEALTKLGPVLGQVAVFAGLMASVFALFTLTGIGKRAWRAIEETVFSNWRLALLGATGLVLSLASGYTTWDGMKNFTGEPVLSLGITFGIQGVMLIVAWLIGESFATGMNERAPDGSLRKGGADAVIGMMLGLAAVGLLFFWMLRWSGAAVWTNSVIPKFEWAKFADVAMYFAMGVLLFAVVLLNRNAGLALPYIQSTRVMIKNAMLWVMFLACMATSVFFSFDSLFTAIFPQSERVRAAELRAQNQVAGMVADIGSTIDARALSARDELFQSKGWAQYEVNLAALGKASQGAEREIEQYFVQQMEARRSAIAQQQERIASATSGQAGLVSKKGSLTDELSRLKGERPTLATEFSEKKTELDTRARGVDAKRVEAMAEEKGVEGTGKVGKGQVYRQRVDELGKLQDAYKIQEDRVRDAQKRLTAVDTRIAQIERELAAVDGDIAKLKGEAQTAEQRIQAAEVTKDSEAGPKVDPARVRNAFEVARADFRQAPDSEKLSAMHQRCVQLFNAMASTPATREKVRSIDCDPKQAAEASGLLFALQAGGRVFETACAGGDKLAAHKTADDLFGFARKCLADSGLPSKETDALRTRINGIELARDDKAHRFVVTWNAFNDGNRLAYLALAIAIAIDSLVFMSGLFGANAVRSPLSEIPRDVGRSASQLEAIIDTALMPHTFETARHVLGAMRPMTPRDGFMARVIIDADDAHGVDLARVLNAGATIGAVRHSGSHENIYEIRSELFEYLSTVAKREFEANKEHVSLAELERTISVALLPDVGANAEHVLHYIQPLDSRPSFLENVGLKGTHGFTGEIKLDEVDAAHQRVVRNALNAGATLARVQRADKTHYFIHGDVYKTLVRIRARTLNAAPAALRVGGHGAGPIALEAHAAAAIAAPAGVAPQAQIPAPAATVEVAMAAAAQAPIDTQALRWDYWAKMVSALGLKPETTSELLNAADVRTSLQAVSDALADHAERNRRLRQLIKRHEDDQSDPLSAEYSILLRDVNGDQRRRNVLEAVNEEIEASLPLLILLPGNGLLEYLTSELERAVQSDDGLAAGEQDLLDAIREANRLVGTGNLSDPAHWQRIASTLAGAVPFPRRADAGRARG
jgi:hypothetical protein